MFMPRIASGCLFVVLVNSGLVENRLNAQEDETGDKQPPFVEKFLINGELDAGEQQLQAKLAAQPGDDQTRFELGILQFFQTVEHLAQNMYDLGQEQNIGLGFVPFMRMPIPHNHDPDEVKLEDVKKAFSDMVDDLKKTKETLGKIKSSDVNARLHPFKIRLDFDNDGKADSEARTHELFVTYLGVRQRANQDFKKIAIDFDRADAEWMLGYCHLLSAMCETILAYDQTELWDTIAHRIFQKAIVKHDFFLEEKKKENPRWNSPGFFVYFADFVAAIRHCHFKIKEPERLKKAHAHLLSMIKHSRQMWVFVEKETDKQNEWIPSPSQSNPFARQNITREMTRSWDVFLNESEAILKGEKLIPFWRGTNPKRGVNLHKVFHAPQDLDLVDCIQGPGMIPFLQEGECTDPQTWIELQRTFRGNFVGFAIWIN